MTPPALDHVVRRCLAKDPEGRWQTARDLAQELKWITEGGLQAGVPVSAETRRRSRERLAWIAAGLFLIGLLASLPFTITHFREAPVDTHRLKFSILLPEKASLGSFAISPDSR